MNFPVRTDGERVTNLTFMQVGKRADEYAEIMCRYAMKIWKSGHKSTGDDISKLFDILWEPEPYAEKVDEDKASC